MASSMLQEIQKTGKDKFCDRDITMPSPNEPHHQFYNYFNPSLINPQLIAHQTAALLTGWPFHNIYPSPLFSGWPMTMPFESKPLLSPLLAHQVSEKLNKNYNTAEEENCKKNMSYMSQGSTSTPISSPASHSGDSIEGLEKKEVTKAKVFQCKICDKTFGYKHVLQNHEKTHTGEKSHVCTVCNKRFRRDHHLKVHQRLHTGVRPYSCTFPSCDRQFVQVANLRRHLKTHQEEKSTAREEEEKIHVNEVKILRIAKPEAIYRHSVKSEYDFYYEKYSDEQTEPEDLSMHTNKKKSC